MRRVSLKRVREVSKLALVRAGLNEEASEIVAEHIALAERDLARSHGLFRLPSWVRALKSGRTNGETRPQVEIRGNAAVVVRADNGFSSAAFGAGKKELVSRAKEHGVCAMSIRDCMHYHALWHDSEELADENLVSLSVLTSKSFVAHHGGREKVYGTNPMAFGYPRCEGLPHLIWDQASASMARGEISMCLEKGERLPDGVAIDRYGQMTRDPIQALAGSQLPFGTYKGSAIALMIELLASMCGAPFSFEQRERCDDDTSTTPTPCGQFIIALNPIFFKPHDQSELEFLNRNELLFEKILSEDGILPSTGKHCGSERLSIRKQSELNGVDIPVELYEECVLLGEECA